MTEGQWRSCADPQAILGFLHDSGKATDRKLRLFAVACCRRVWGVLDDERGQQAVEAAERYADGLVTAGKLSACLGAARAACRNADTNAQRDCADPKRAAAVALAAHATLFVSSARLAVWEAGETAFYAASATATAAEAAAAVAGSRVVRSIPYHAERSVQCDLLRDLFGNPFGEPPALDSVWRSPAVVALARAVYDERRFEDIPVLADALEEAGCMNAEILGHLRRPEPHARGCWALDLLLDKE